SFSAADDVATSIVGFTVDDIRRASEHDFSTATKLVTTTFDGVKITLRVIRQGETYWATVYAEAAPDKSQAAIEGRTIDATHDGWGYKVPGYKGAQMMATLESLLKPLPGKNAPATPKSGP